MTPALPSGASTEKQEASGGFACPICGTATPHGHSLLEVLPPNPALSEWWAASNALAGRLVEANRPSDGTVYLTCRICLTGANEPDALPHREDCPVPRFLWALTTAGSAALPSGARQQEEQTASRAASAASPSDSGDATLAELARLRAEVALYDPAAIAAYAESKESSAYARGRKERDAEWREALRDLSASCKPSCWEQDSDCPSGARFRSFLSGTASASSPPASSEGTENTQQAATRDTSNSEER